MSNSIWTDEITAHFILDCASGLELNRMPSREELNNYYGNSSLTNHIRRSGGYYYWAERLSLPMKESETQTGKLGEERAMDLLEQHGFSAKRMSTKYPYDIYVNGAVKIDVKTANPTKTTGQSKCYSFGLSKRCPTCDIYFLLANKPGGETVYIVPSSINQTQICIGEGKSKYDRYIDRYDIIRRFCAVFKPSMTF